MYLFRKTKSGATPKKRPHQVVAMWALFQMLHADGAPKADSLCTALRVTRNYKTWSKEDDEWFWRNLREDWQKIRQKTLEDK